MQTQESLYKYISSGVIRLPCTMVLNITSRTNANHTLWLALSVKFSAIKCLYLMQWSERHLLDKDVIIFLNNCTTNLSDIKSHIYDPLILLLQTPFGVLKFQSWGMNIFCWKNTLYYYNKNIIVLYGIVLKKKEKTT